MKFEFATGVKNLYEMMGNVHMCSKKSVPPVRSTER